MNLQVHIMGAEKVNQAYGTNFIEGVCYEVENFVTDAPSLYVLLHDGEGNLRLVNVERVRFVNFEEYKEKQIKEARLKSQGLVNMASLLPGSMVAASRAIEKR